ncbi:MAG: pilin [Candidatus Buchananbacteria bacterium]
MNRKIPILAIIYFASYLLLFPWIAAQANYIDDCLKQQQDQLDNCESDDTACQQQAADDFSLCKNEYEAAQNAQLAASDAATAAQSGDLILNVPIGAFMGGNVNENLLGNYIKAWYDLMLGVIGIVATIMIMWAGFKWLLARGDSGKITDAKSMIFSALAGLALALLSYTLISIVNPDLSNINFEGREPIVQNYTPLTDAELKKLFQDQLGKQILPETEQKVRATLKKSGFEIYKPYCNSENAATLPASAEMGSCLQYELLSTQEISDLATLGTTLNNLSLGPLELNQLANNKFSISTNPLAADEMLLMDTLKISPDLIVGGVYQLEGMNMPLRLTSMNQELVEWEIMKN